ncbi:hypothetical protein MNV49_007098 [Pseudohyphozyma bogoriensis]|nr:hypothetical protein MNV49_007098 [Pseudohyphozyma bogoriensis]
MFARTLSRTRAASLRTAVLSRSATTAAASPAASSPAPVPSSSSTSFSPTTSRRASAPPPAPTPSPRLPGGALEAFTPLPQTHGIHVATLYLRCYTDSLTRMTFFASFAMRSALALGLPTSNLIAHPTKTSLYTVPRSPFAHKKSQENFWKKEHKRAIKVYDGDREVVEAWLAYLRKEDLAGVGMKVEWFEFKEVGWGQKMVDLSRFEKGEEAAVKELAGELEEELLAQIQAEGAQEGNAVKKVLEEVKGEKEEKKVEGQKKVDEVVDDVKIGLAAQDTVVEDVKPAKAEKKAKAPKAKEEVKKA